jgi:hypothetical protein
MRLFPTLVIASALVAGAEAQDRSDWQSLAQLRAGDNLRLSLKTGPVKGAFQSWTPQDVTAGSVIAKKDDVLKIERYRHGGGRGRRAALGALIGFGGGFVIGVAADPRCNPGEFLCFEIPRGLAGVAVGVLGAGIGAGIGALLPGHPKELIYSAK